MHPYLLYTGFDSAGLHKITEPVFTDWEDAVALCKDVMHSEVQAQLLA
jgi:hypothetical protein